MSDMVNSPEHYTQGSVEAIDMIRIALTEEQFRGYCIGNMIKYRLRAPFKGNLDQDLSKAAWYYNKIKGSE